MTYTQHTLGPWYPDYPYQEEGIYVSAGATELVCKLIGPDSRANANLIASAPELLAENERLKGVNLELLGALEIALYDLAVLNAKDPTYLPRCAVKAKKAIAKAKGDVV